jgi:hypothetical protein
VIPSGLAWFGQPVVAGVVVFRGAAPEHHSVAVAVVELDTAGVVAEGHALGVVRRRSPGDWVDVNSH